MNKRNVVFITDCTDIAAAEIRASFLSNLSIPLEEINLEPIVPVSPFSIINANFVLRLMAEQYPEGSIFSVIVNPLKERTERIAGVTKLRNQFFFSTNTGAVSWLINDFGCDDFIEIKDPGFIPFGGKYVHAPAVSRFVSGKLLNEIGNPFPSEKIRTINIAEGMIVHIDNFGLIKFNSILPESKNGDIYEVTLGQQTFKMVYSNRMMNNDDETWVIYPGSSMRLAEIGQVRRNGLSILNPKIGDIIRYKKLWKATQKIPMTKIYFVMGCFTTSAKVLLKHYCYTF